MSKNVTGFSKYSKSEKIEWLLSNFLSDSEDAASIIKQYWNPDQSLQKLHDEFIENTISNYYLPLGIAPNFNINGDVYTIPMVTEESSVVAAASKAAKYWGERGGFKAAVISTVKIGHVHFNFNGPVSEMKSFFDHIKQIILDDCKSITSSMEKRGGGILDIVLKDKTSLMEHYFQIEATFDTQDAMGANFINSCLEQMAATLSREASSCDKFIAHNYSLEIIMSILSNYTPNCIAHATVNCSLNHLAEGKLSGREFAEKFIQAVNIARLDPYRAVTHNKGIMNGIDAVVIATGNDFRAVEAAAHAYASKDGSYGSLTKAWIEKDEFYFSIELPLALGTVGGLTGIHPLVGVCLSILNHPTAEQLMKITATVGLAQNFGAIRSLITTGIQQGHMKMHLLNILNRYSASDKEKTKLLAHFKTNVVTHTAVVSELEKLRQ